ncbi:hypothetical protein MKO06_15230 [Gramella sp. GC03-9]|uniref:Uncharacterized protein n=1 Tax=Christiangramia oceanisediminis TaxID=2920386 RepID=A0A9X2KZV6_9FLAO|nr:hypothetical protein [Gramella oceanisediminis]MCP9201261.1 hypothetical protein [Gramella oceanisediminis]
MKKSKISILRNSGGSLVNPVYFFLICIALGISGCSDDDDNSPPDEVNQSIDLILIAENMVSPVGLVPSPDNSGNLYVID